MVSSPTSAIVYSGNNSTVTPYPVPFPFLLGTDIYVARTTSGGVTTVLNAGVDFTLTPTPDSNGAYSGGSLVTTVAYDNTNLITVFRQVPITQLTELPEAGPFPALSLELAYDKVTMIVQQLHRRILALEGTSDGGAVVVVPNGAGASNNGVGVQVFADATARGNATPVYVGQFGWQVDARTWWYAHGAGAGAWSQAPYVSATQKVLGRKTAGAGAAEECTVSEILNFFAGAADGMIPYRSGGAWSAVSRGADVQVFTANGTWTKPAHATWVEGWIIGAGGGGGSGRRGAAATIRAGGGGGAGGGFCWFCVHASSFAATVAVVVGAAGTGGAAVTVDSTNGNAGGNGGDSTFQARFKGTGGNGGGGGTNAAGGAGGTGVANTCVPIVSASFTNSAGGAGTAGGATGGSGTTQGSPTGGGGGGGVDAANAVFSPGSGGTVGASGVVIGVAGVGGGAGGAGGAGNAATPFGSGGGGGNASASGAGLAGGQGGWATGIGGAGGGGGGGGGGGCLNGFASGAGGDGGKGCVIIKST